MSSEDGDGRAAGRYAYSPGPHPALAADGCLLLVPGPADASVLDRLWPLVDARASVSDIVGELAGAGLRNTGAFGLVRFDGAIATVVVRGDVVVEAATSDGATRRVTARGVATWVETTLEAGAGPVTVGVGLEDAASFAADRPILGLRAGIVLCDRIELHPDGSAVVSTEHRPPNDQLNDHSNDAPEPIALPVTAPISSEPVRSEPVATEPVATEPVASEPPRSEPLTQPPTQLMPIPEALPDAAPAAGAPGLIDHLLLGGRPEPEPPETEPEPPEPESAEPEATLDRAALAALDPTMELSGMSEADQAAAATGPTGPTVPAVVCPFRHLSPPYSSHCRVCGSPIAAQEPIVTARPPLGLLRLSTGDIVPLDRGVILGRNPRAGDERDPGRPHVVRLASPTKDISRSHVEVRLDEWHVLVTDLGSTNGTTVTVPGQAPVRLRPHEPMPVEANTEVNLADEVVFRFEVTE